MWARDWGANGCARLEGGAVVVGEGGGAQAEVREDGGAVLGDGLGVRARTGAAAARLERVETPRKRDQALLDLAGKPLRLGPGAVLLEQRGGLRDCGVCGKGAAEL